MGFCGNCGVELRDEQVFCTQCGAPTADRYVACHPSASCCGTEQPAASVPQMKSRVTAGLLGIIVGGVGAHKFYLGQNIGGFPIGVIYLIFCLTGIPAILALVEGIIYLTKTDDEFYRLYVVEKKNMF